MVKFITNYFKGAVLREISVIDVQRYLTFLGTEYQGRFGRPLTPKTLHHQYNTLHLIFGFAEKQDMLVKNPMEKVDAPKKDKKPVDALTKEQAQRLFSLLPLLPLDFRCIMNLLVTTGMRRGECMGLQWSDLDEEARVIRISRNAVCSSHGKVAINTPKTSNSVRSIPVMDSTVQLLHELKKQMQQENPHTILKNAFLFPSEKDIFQPRDPNSVTRRVKRFMRNNGFPDLSPHDLRHSCATLLLSQGADIKSVQEIFLWLHSLGIS